MARQAWYPYAPDQQFGVRVAADEVALDLEIARWDARRAASPPRPGNKAPVALSPLPSWVDRDCWGPLQFLAGDTRNGPLAIAELFDETGEGGVSDG